MSGRALRLSPRALADLAEIGDRIALDAPIRAVTFVDELLDACRRAGERPEAFPARPDLAPGLRVAVHGRYLVLFRVLPDPGGRGEEVRVERVVHGARRLRGLS